MEEYRKVEKIKRRSHTHLPRIGQRIIKTSIAVFLCLLIHYIIGFEGMMLQSCITAIICIQPYMNDTKEFAFNRGIGTLIGAFWGLIFLLIMDNFDFIKSNMVLIYLCMALGVLFVIYSTVLMRLKDAAGLSAIIFLCIVVGFPNFDSPLVTTLSRLIDTFIGIGVAVVVNLVKLPTVRKENTVFFVRLNDLVADRLSEISSGTLIALNHLYQNNAKISLVSPWAPAHILSQVEELQIKTPSIVMDGAALYDISKRRYLKLDPLEFEDANYLCRRLKEMNLGYCVYAVRNNTTLIYRQGNLNEAERMELDKLEQSDLRNYLDGFYSKEDNVCCVRTIDVDAKIEELAQDLRWDLPQDIYRIEVRKQPFLPGYSGIYFYSAASSVDNMKKYLCEEYFSNEGTPVESVDLLPTLEEYDPAKDSIHLIHKLRRLYMRVGFEKKEASKEAKEDKKGEE